MKKIIVVFLLYCIVGVAIAQDGNFDWMNDPNDPIMQMFRESQRREQEESRNRPVWDLDTPPMWGGTSIEGMFVLYTKNDTRETVLLRNNNRVQFSRVNLGSSTVDRFVDGNKRADFQFNPNGGVVYSVEMVFENRTHEEYMEIVNRTKADYGSALTVIYENQYRAASSHGATIGVADAKFNVWGTDGWTIEIEFVTRNVPMSGENSRVLRIRESKNIVLRSR